jgi:hypothetical protein
MNMKMSRFLSNVYNIRVRVVSDIQTLAFGSSLYIRYNTAAHVVNITYNMHPLELLEHLYRKQLRTDRANKYEYCI